MTEIAVVVGTRPEIIKLSSVVDALDRQSGVHLKFVHTGQHYDWNMSNAFLKELDLPEPNIFLEVRSGTNLQQVARVITRLEKHLSNMHIDWLVVEGDTNSAMAAAMVGAKLGIPVAHVEAGCRSYDPRMQEELNRRVISECATLNLTPSRNCTLNLMREGVPLSKIRQTGHPIVEIVRAARQHAHDEEILDKFGLEPEGFAFATLHRAENVDDPKRLRTIIRSLAGTKCKVVFPVHPRTRRRMREFRIGRFLERDCFLEIAPMSYMETLAMIKNSAFVFTDSGGVQQEALLLGTPCLTARENTEWVETVLAGANTLVGASERLISKNANFLLNHVSTVKKRLKDANNSFGDGKATQRIVRALAEPIDTSTMIGPWNFLRDGIPLLRVAKIDKKIHSSITRRLLPYINMVFDVNGKPIALEGRKVLSVSQSVLMFAPQKVVEDFENHYKVIRKRRSGAESSS